MEITTGKLFPTHDEREGLDLPAAYLENEHTAPTTLRANTYVLDKKARAGVCIEIRSEDGSDQLTLLFLSWQEASALARRLDELVPVEPAKEIPEKEK